MQACSAGAIEHWPALTTWRDTAWWLRRAGHRTVPLEIGASGSTACREAAMLLAVFFERFLQPSLQQDAVHGELAAPGCTGGCTAEPDAAQVAYLAQPRLFNQVPELKEDIEELPLWEAGSETVNMWLGTRGTVTPLHYDSMDNFFCQVAGALSVCMLTGVIFGTVRCPWRLVHM